MVAIEEIYDRQRDKWGPVIETAIAEMLDCIVGSVDEYWDDKKYTMAQVLDLPEPSVNIKCYSYGGYCQVCSKGVLSKDRSACVTKKLPATLCSDHRHEYARHKKYLDKPLVKCTDCPVQYRIVDEGVTALRCSECYPRWKSSRSVQSSTDIVKKRPRSTRRPRRSYVYKIYTGGHQLLYVGKTVNLLQRFYDSERGSHSSTKWWFTQAVYVELLEFKNEDDALEAEAWLIKNESPSRNKVRPRTTKVRSPRPIQSLCTGVDRDSLAKVWLR